MRRILRWIRNIVLFFFISTLLTVVMYAFLPVYITPLMVINGVKAAFKGEKTIIKHTWVPLKEISPNLALAVVASEDNLFMSHSGFDFKQIEKAIKENKTRKRPRGASTISQQTAKNVFLWPAPSYFRKGLEAYFTYLIELVWGKERIMEVYLNSIEMGKDIYGAEAVAKYHFKTTAAKLSRKQAALIAATLPNPIIYNSAKPSRYVLRRQAKILDLMSKVAPVKFE